MKEVAHTVLYRKYRPAKFEDVRGQENVISLISSAVASGKPAHAYLFTGGRGLGKTTVARIFATALNTQPVDIYEIDAASRRGIDDIRELREHVRGAPMESKYKVYIIDEVHMLTKEAFNALLKTLEEPGEHVIFILATTEIDKVPDTIRSRSQIMQFRHPSQEILENYIADIAKLEKVKITKEAVTLLAQLADRSYRDACGRLEESIVRSNGSEINADVISESFGVPSSKMLNDLTKAICLADVDSANNATSAPHFNSMNHELLLTLILARVRSVHMLRHKMITIAEVEKTFGQDESKFIETVAMDANNKLNSQIIIKLLDAYNLIRRSPIKSLPLELVISDILGQ
jgi:DNA polymerase-3 subunit gamma/tau